MILRRLFLALIASVFALILAPAFALTNQVNAATYCAFDGAQVVGTVTLTAGSPNATIAGASFAPADAGKVINIQNGGGGSTSLVTSILSVQSATQITLNTNAPASISSLSTWVTYGTDETTCLNQFFSYVTSNSAYGVMPSGTAVFIGQLSVPSASNWTVLGTGSNQSLMLYAGANTSSDLMTIGDGVNPPGFVKFGGFRIDSATPMTGGTAIHARMVSFSKFTDIEAGLFSFLPNGPRTLHNGLWFDQVQWTILDGFRSELLGDALAANGGATGINGELTLDNIQIAYCGGTALHIGGGLGGVYTGYVSLAANNRGIVIDQALMNTNNRELFFGPRTAVDSSALDNVLVNQTVNSGSITWDAWSASAGATGPSGPSNVAKGFVIAAFANGVVNIHGGTFYNSKGDGIYVGDSSTRVQIASAVRIDANGQSGTGYGVNGTYTSNVLSDASPVNNVTGRYSGSVGVESLNPASGFRKYGNGEIHEWGIVAGSGSDTNVTFPIAFPTAVMKITPTIYPAVSSAGVLENVSVYNQSQTGFTGGPRYVTSGGVGRAGEQWQWEAWGN